MINVFPSTGDREDPNSEKYEEWLWAHKYGSIIDSGIDKRTAFLKAWGGHVLRQSFPRRFDSSKSKLRNGTSTATTGRRLEEFFGKILGKRKIKLSKKMNKSYTIVILTFLILIADGTSIKVTGH